MSLSITSQILTHGNQSVQFHGLFAHLRSWRWRIVSSSVCRMHSQCRGVTVQPHRVVGFGYSRTGIMPTYLSPLSPGVRWFSDDERDRNDDDRRNVPLKGFVFHFPNPMAWLKNKWFTYRIQSLVDSSFNLGDFLVGAKQALSFLTRLMVMKDFETLRTVATEEAVEKIQQIIEPWSSEQQQSIEVLVGDINLTSATITSLVKGPEYYNVFVDFLCLAVKRYKTRPLLIHITVRFMREYRTSSASDWLISDISQLQVRELTSSKDSDQHPK